MRRVSQLVLNAPVASCVVMTHVALLHTGASGESSSTEREKEEARQREMEEEEFRVFDAEREDADMLPIAHRLAAKADALDAELQRLSYVLFEKPQLIVDTRAATLTGRPANISAVLQRFAVDCAGSSRPATWARPVGSSSLLVQALLHLQRLVRRLRRGARVEKPPCSDELMTLTADLDYLRHMKRLHALNFYSRMNMTPKRHFWLAFYAVLWNVVIALQNALGCIVFGAMRGVRDRNSGIGFFYGTAVGLLRASQFLTYGLLLSPLIHIPSGLCNTVYGMWNAVSGTLFFEVGSGRWQYCTAMDSVWLRHDLQLEQRAIRSVGRLEFRRKKMVSEEKWQQRLASMGFSFDWIHSKMTAGRKWEAAGGKTRALDDPYEVLQVKRSATQAEVKAQYKNLAKVFHPDVVRGSNGGPPCEQERLNAQRKFENISQAYQILSNPEKRKSFDIGGAQALRLHESKMGRFMSRTPEEMVQSVFGGEPFRQKVLGPLLRSHWHLRNEAQVSVSLHEFEELQCLRCRELALELSLILDVHAKSQPRSSNQKRTPQSRNEVMQSMMGTLSGGSANLKRRGPHAVPKQCTSSDAAGDTAGSAYVLTPGSNYYNCFSRDFEERCDRFCRRLSDACFGRELMYEVGQSYIISSQRFLGIRPFYAPKLHVYKKIFSGADRIYAAFREKIDTQARNNPEWLAQKVMVEYFSMEFDSVIADMSAVLRFAAQNVVQDVTVSEEQRRRRCYALWYLGEQMVRKGALWSATPRDDAELMAYLQQAANSASSTSKPDTF